MRAVRISLLASAICLASFSMPSLASATPSICDAVTNNLVADCGFEGPTTLDASSEPRPAANWSVNSFFDNFGFNRIITAGGTDVNSGTNALALGNLDSGQGTPAILQTFADTAGTTYSGSIWVLYGGAGLGDSGAFFDLAIDFKDLVSLTDAASGSYTEYFFSFTGTGSDSIELSGDTNPSEWFIDDISITGPTVTTTVPEPGTLMLMAAGLAILGVMSRKRKTS